MLESMNSSTVLFIPRGKRFSEHRPAAITAGIKPCGPSLLSGLRREKDLSQRALAWKMGISRAHLQRLENKPGDRLSLGELELLAKGLGMKAEELIGRFVGSRNGREIFSRASVEKPFFAMDVEAAAQIASYLKHSEDCFIGNLALAPQKSLSRDQIPQGKFLFYFVLQGRLLLTLFGKEYFFKEGECFSLEGGYPYDFYNPHQFQKMNALLFSLPAFIRTAAAA